LRYLTKSRFALALECLTKLYYVNKPEYANNSLDDPFLLELAKGGYQVGELAKYIFSNDPVADKITIDSDNNDEALKLTKEKLLSHSNTIIAEAAFRYESLFVRVDILEKKGNILSMYEVKSKSVDGDNEKFLTKKEDKVIAEWSSYLYDIAFQKFVLSRAETTKDFTLIPFLILVDKTKTCSIDGMNRMFKVIRKGKNSKEVLVQPGLKKSDLDTSVLKIINVSEYVDKIINKFPVPTNYGSAVSFEDFVNLASNKYSEDEKIVSPLSRECRTCQFNNRKPELQKLKSGFLECWKTKTNYDDNLLEKNLVTDLWYGGTKDLMDKLLTNGVYLINKISESDIMPKTENKNIIGMTLHQRRMEQINRIKAGTEEPFFDKIGFQSELASWAWPLHMIDFETTTPAIPFNKGRRPYEGIAFQFSHHIMEKNGSIRHAGQYISFEPGKFPNYEFLRELKKQLEVDNGSIFRYHNHENTYLNLIHAQLCTDPETPVDKDELQGFIREITSHAEGKEKLKGPRDMIDLFLIVRNYYYPPYAKGSNSIKKILPAIIKDSDFLRDKYSKPIYGKNLEIPSLNFERKIWIDLVFDNDPYRTLPKLFEGYGREELDELLSDLDEVADGGAAMSAYGYLQYSDVSQQMREEIRDALLRYCELDTMAMVMLIEGLMNK